MGNRKKEDQQAEKIIVPVTFRGNLSAAIEFGLSKSTGIIWK